MYTNTNFRTKKELEDAVKAYIASERKEYPVMLFAPGLGAPAVNGTESVEGPHYPAPHTWYATVLAEDEVVVKVK